MTDYEKIVALTTAMLLESQASMLMLVSAIAMQVSSGADDLRKQASGIEEYCDQMLEVAQVLREASDDR